jgi:hypothetical protein
MEDHIVLVLSIYFTNLNFNKLMIMFIKQGISFKCNFHWYKLFLIIMFKISKPFKSMKLDIYKLVLQIPIKKFFSSKGTFRTTSSDHGFKLFLTYENTKTSFSRKYKEICNF